MIKHIACPNCGTRELVRDRAHNLVCESCGSVYRRRDVVCANCSTPNPASARHCSACGEPLARHCRACGRENPGDAQTCASCGTPLDVLEFISRRYAGAESPDRQELVRAKAEGTGFMNAQSERLHEADRQYRATLQAQKAEQMRQERLVLLAVAIGGVLVLVVIVVGLLLGR